MQEIKILRSFRLLPDDLKFMQGLASNDSTVSDVFINIIQYYRSMKAMSENELRGHFTPNEWMFFAATLKGLKVDEAIRYQSAILIAHNKDAELYNHSAKEYKVDLYALNLKLGKMGAAHIDAIYSRVEKYWNTPDAPTLKEWAEF